MKKDKEKTNKATGDILKFKGVIKSSKKLDKLNIRLFEEELDEAWQEYKDGKVITHEELMKKHCG